MKLKPNIWHLHVVCLRIIGCGGVIHPKPSIWLPIPISPDPISVGGLISETKRQRQRQNRFMPLPKMPPRLSRRVELWRRRAKVVDENGEHHKPTRSNDNNKQTQTFNSDKEKENGNLGVRRADQPLVFPSSPSFKSYILPPVRENKNDGNVSIGIQKKNERGSETGEKVENDTCESYEKLDSQKTMLPKSMLSW
ncbi:hypothetical protein V6N13_030736 [Hibiscus sabdariffa]|uniref:Uncharacterized protein n=1 Tax=Hibiscus sabdariffa TaxID=183260 RepID=A0ABR2D639_9ROSI